MTAPEFSIEQATIAVMNDFKPDYVIYEENDLPTNAPVKAALRSILPVGYVKIVTISGGWHYGPTELWKLKQ